MIVIRAPYKRRIFYRCVDWNKRDAPPVPEPKSRIFYRCVDWNKRSVKVYIYSLSHLLQMRGLKRNTARRRKPIRGRIFYRCVDWNLTQAEQHLHMKSHLLQMRGLKPLFKGAFERVFNVASFTGTTIYNIFCKKITGLKYLFVRK